MRDEIIDAHEAAPIAVAARIIDTIPAQKPHFYMKHMPHHMLDGFPLDWTSQCANVHLIRHPARVVASYGQKRAETTLEDIGFVQQADLFDKIGGIVIDSADIRQAPEAMLRKLCDAIDLDFDPAMLRWPAGPRQDDGIWAKHWYNAVHKSTGFAGAEGPLPQLDAYQASVASSAMPFYEKLSTRKLTL